jgi:hypothetical protein
LWTSVIPLILRASTDLVGEPTQLDQIGTVDPHGDRIARSREHLVDRFVEVRLDVPNSLDTTQRLPSTAATVSS